MSPAQYLELERQAERKSEYFRGEMFALPGATRKHCLIATNVIVACAPQFADDQQDTLLNPVALIEVLSKSTRDYDRGEKFEHYRTLQSLTEYLTVAQDRPHIEHWVRQDNGWRLVEYADLTQTIQLASIGTALPLAEIYDKVDFAA